MNNYPPEEQRTSHLLPFDTKCVIRILDSSWDETYSLISAFKRAQQFADRFKYWVSVYDSHGFVAIVLPNIPNTEIDYERISEKGL